MLYLVLMYICAMDGRFSDFPKHLGQFVKKVVLKWKEQFGCDERIWGLMVDYIDLKSY